MMLVQIGKWILAAGVALMAFGVILYVLGRLGLPRLPGDFAFGGKNWRVYLPIGTSLLLSILLTFILWLILRASR